MTIFQKIIAYGHAKQYNNNTHFTVTVPRSLIEYCNVPHQIKNKKVYRTKGGNCIVNRSILYIILFLVLQPPHHYECYGKNYSETE